MRVVFFSVTNLLTPENSVFPYSFQNRKGKNIVTVKDKSSLSFFL